MCGGGWPRREPSRCCNPSCCPAPCRFPPASLPLLVCCAVLCLLRCAAQVLTTSDDLKTSACCTAGAPPPLIRKALAKVPDEVKAKYYGCGSPFPMGIEGLRCGGLLSWAGLC